MSRLIKLNAPEWPYLVVGLIAAVVAGAVQPLMGLVFAKMSVIW
jgi:hypothetical protein